MNKCYLCGRELKDSNLSDEHIVLNAIGGRLHSKKLICKDCNSEMGNKADSKLAEDLSFFTDMLEISRSRKSEHNQIMTDSEGHEIIVKKAGKSLTLRKPYKEVYNEGSNTIVNIAARNIVEVKSFVSSLVKDGIITQEQGNEIIKKSEVKEYKSPLHKSMCISKEAFPSIVKSAVNFYVEKTNDIDTVKHLIPVIKGEEDTKGFIFLYVLKELPFPYNEKEAVHMIHIEGSKETGLLYALMEYYSIYTYVVVLNDKYEGDNINMTYAFDAVSSQEIRREFSLPLAMSNLVDFKSMPHEKYCAEYLPCIAQRADNVMKIWDAKQNKEELQSVIEKAFGKFPEGCIIDEAMIKSIENDIVEFFIRKLDDSNIFQTE